MAASAGYLDIGEILIVCNCDLNPRGRVVDSVTGKDFIETPLYVALINRDFDFARLIMAADFDIRNEMSLAGVVDSEQSRNLWNAINDLDPEIVMHWKKLLSNLRFNPRSLESLARSSVRKCIQSDFSTKICKLGLPTLIQDNLLYDILDTLAPASDMKPQNRVRCLAW